MVQECNLMRFLFFFISLFLSYSLTAQTSGKRMTVSIGLFSSSGPYDYMGTVGVTGTTGFDIDDVVSGDLLFDANSRVYRIDSIEVIVTGTTAYLWVTDIWTNGSAPISGKGNISEPTPNFGLLRLTQNGSAFITEEQEARMINYNFDLIDSLVSTIQTGYTVIDSNHTKSVGDLVTRTPISWPLAKAQSDSLPVGVVGSIIDVNKYSLLITTVQLPSYDTIAVGDYLFLQSDGSFKDTNDEINIPSFIKLDTNNYFKIVDWRPFQALTQPVDSSAIVQDSIYVTFKNGIEVTRDTIRVASEVVDINYNQPGPILRIPQVGETINSVTVKDWITNAFYYRIPTITLNTSTLVYQVGTSNSITLSGSTDNPAGETLSGGELNKIYPTLNTINSFGASISYSQGITFTPQQGGSGDYNEFEYRFQANQDYTGVQTGNVTSGIKYVYGVYPILHGMSTQDSLGVLAGNPYTALSQLVEREGNKTIVFDSDTPAYFYIGIPNTWGDTDFSLIWDQNDFNTTNTWKKYEVQVSSSGLINNWTNVTYTFYQWPIQTTADNYDYDFFQ